MYKLSETDIFLYFKKYHLQYHQEYKYKTYIFCQITLTKLYIQELYTEN